jgi:hypothetical protein
MNLPPPPIRESNQTAFVWQTWYRKISEFLSSNSLPWSFVNKTGSSLSDIETRPHSALQSILGSGAHHLSETQHTDLTDAGNTILHKHTHNLQDGLQGGAADDMYHFTAAQHTDLTDAGNTILHKHTHNLQDSLQGGAADDMYHFTAAQHTDLTDAGDSALHYHASDRNRANHTGAAKFGDVAGGNYAEFESDGTLRFYGNATIWQDIDFPIIIRTTGANIPVLTTLQGNVTAPQWAVNDFSVCEAQELVHAWKEGSEVQWHIHFVTNGLDATDRYVNFEVEWFWVNPNGTLSATITSSGDLLIPESTATKTMLIRQVSVATFAGVIGGHVYARLRRIASTGMAPTNNPWCSMLQLHIECDTVGSRERTTK